MIARTTAEQRMKTYISASRRTDIPRFFTSEFFTAWQKGEITYNGGYGRTWTVSLKPEDVCGYIFWSKDFAPFIGHPLFEKLIGLNNAVFHFTVNDCPDLEPRVAPLARRIETLRMLCDMVGAERVFWRFDPICKYRGRDGGLKTSEEAFFTMLPFMQKAAIKHCFFSFMTFYEKLKGRGVVFAPFSMEEKKDICRRMLSACSQTGMTLYNCCNREIPGLVPGIRIAHCIDEAILRATDRFGVHRPLSTKPTRDGCGCFESRDIGSYRPGCPHGCLYCYAHPQIPVS
jgi:hypothetical protein